MATRQPDPKTALAQDLAGELQGDSKQLAAELFAHREPGGKVLPEAEYADLVRRNWGTAIAGPDGASVPWQVQEAQRNPEAFLAAFRGLGGVLPGEPGHPSTPPHPLDFNPTALNAPPSA